MIPKILCAADLKTAPLTAAETLPATWYTDADFSTFDRTAIFHDSWQYLGPAARAPQPGTFMVEDVGVVPLIVVHNQDGQYRAFANVCRHRGGVLATEDGHGRVLRCHYHGWCYDLEGKLTGTPHFADKQSLKPEQKQLPEFAAHVWQGLVFVNLSPNPRPFSEVFAGISARVPTACEFHHRAVHLVAANWKVYVDNYLEGYHVPTVHPELSQVIDNAAYHYELSAHSALQWSPVAASDNPYGTQGTAYYFWIFPNTMLNILPGRLQVNTVRPTGPSSCSVYFDSYFSAPVDSVRAAADIKFSDLVQAQDAAVCLAVQRGLNSGTYHTGRLVPSQEKAVHHFHNLVRQSYRNYLADNCT